MKPRIFLLGGKDLEMLTIRQLLEQYGEAFYDKNLAWGAKLSDYADELQDCAEKGITAYGIELTADITPPANYVRIDHHNDLPPQPSALEQVATLIGHAVTREERLVAANDHGFIPAMQAMGASPEEIARIRAMDREAQGITQADEELAEQSIRELRTQRGRATVIQSLPKLFTPIADRMYGQTNRLVCWRPHKLTYYGEGAGQLALQFAEWIADKTAYAGGGEHGYFGIADMDQDPTEFEHRKKLVIQSVE